jgi:hypothetical protein
MVTVASAALSFTPGFSMPGQVPDWQSFVNANRPPQHMSLPRAGTWFHGLLTGRFQALWRGAAPASPLDRVMRRLLEAETPAAADGIVVAGSRAEDIVVAGNRISGVLCGADDNYA